MIIPKNKKKYKSVKKFKVTQNSKITHCLQLQCYKGHFPMICSNCVLSKNCWFCGLKEV